MSVERFDIYGQRLDDHEPLSRAWFVRCSDYDALAAENAALRKDAGKVTCRRCLGHGDLLQPDAVPPGWRTDPCPDCTDLRTLLPKEKRP